MAADHESAGSSGERSITYKGTRPGGRSARVRDAVLAAVAIELMEHGYADLSMGRIAARAGVASTTIHRRWGSRARLVADMFDANAVTAVPDPGLESLEADLRAFAHGAAAGLAQPAVQSLLRGMFSLPAEELEPIQEAYWASRIQIAQAIVDRAIDRGELPAGSRGWCVLEPLLAPIWMRRLVTGMPLDDATLEHYVGVALQLSGARVAATAPTSG